MCLGVVVGPEGAFRSVRLPVANIFMLVPPMSLTNTM